MVLMSFLSSVLEPYLVWPNPGHPSPPSALGGIVGLTVDRCITPSNALLRNLWFDKGVQLKHSPVLIITSVNSVKY